MKFLSLQLLAYGPFTERRIDFSDRAGFHVMYGPNEAGKSSALRAITDALYGIPARTDDNFFHPYPKLRIGMTLQDRSGQPIEAIRRKAIKQTLRKADDKTLLDDHLIQSLLGDVDRDTFQMMFGIDHLRLRKGGEEMIRGQGRVGQLLFAAGTGMTHLQQIQQKLTSQSEDLFKPRSRTTLLQQKIEQYSTLRQEIRNAQISVETWKQLDNQQKRLEGEKQGIEQQLQAKRQQYNRWRRIHESYAEVVRWQNAQAEWQSLKSVPDLPESFSEQVQSLQNELQQQRFAREQTESQLQKLKPLRDELVLDDQILAEKSVLEDLRDELGSVLKAGRDRPTLVAALEQAEAEAREILRQLGRTPDLENLEPLRIPTPQVAEIQDLGTQQEGVYVRRQALQQECDKICREIARLQEKLTHNLNVAGTAGLRELVQQVQKKGNLQEELERLDRDYDRLCREADILLSQLPLWAGSLRDLERLALPERTTLERFEQRFREQSNFMDSLQGRMQELKSTQERLEQELVNLEREQPILTEQELEQVRELREQGWQLVKREWQGPEPDEAERERYLQQFPGRVLAEAFEWNLQEADRIVDGLRNDVGRVVSKSRLQRDIEEQVRKQTSLAEDLEQAHQQEVVLLRNWTDLWQPLGIVPLPPREMQSWLHKQQELAALSRDLRDRSSVREQLVHQVHQFCEKLSVKLGLDLPAQTSTTLLSELTQLAVQTVEKQQVAQTLQRQLEQDLEAAQERLLETQARLKSAEQDVSAWQARWEAEMQKLGLEPTASPAQANRVLQSFNQLFQCLANAQDKQRRITGIDDDAASFRQRVYALQERIGQAEEAQPPEVCLQSLGMKYRQAEDHQARFQEYSQSIREYEQTLQTAQQKQTQMEALLAEKCRLAGCEQPDQLLRIAEQARRKKQLERELKEREAQILLRSAGHSFQEFMTEVLAESERMELIPDLMAQLEQDIQKLEQERDRQIEELTAARVELARIDGGGQAAEKATQCESLAAGLEEEIQRLAMLRIATAVLQAGIERHRERHQGPVLGRASEFLSQMTCGAFRGLEVVYDDDRDEMVLMGVRAESGEHVKVTGMSDGTCDQLFLSLRLASLEFWLEEREPLPFIVDDILVHFDDARSLAALQVLEQFSQKTQVLFFTHHEHLLRLIEQHLPPDNLQIHHLSH